jgi:putative NIF3 family GTP cyclohydrolase 1 type 2
MQYQGNSGAQVQRVAIVCGAGSGMLNEVFRARADVFVTGEMRFHESLSALSHNVSVVLPGHYATERIAVEALAGRLQNEFGGLKIWPSRAERDPSLWV